LANEEEPSDHPNRHLHGDALIIEPPKPLKSGSEIDRERRDAQDERFKANQINTNNRLVILTVFLVVGSLAGISISVWQASIAQTSSNAAETSSKAAEKAAGVASDALDFNNDQFDRQMRQVISQTVSASTASDTAKKSLIIAQQSLETSINEAHSDRRAYIVTTLNPVRQDPQRTYGYGASDNKYFSEVHYVDIGRTPGISVSVHGQMQFKLLTEETLRRAQTPDYNSTGGKTLSVGVDTTEKLFTQGTDPVQDETYRRQSVSSHTNSVMGYTVFGYISYRDIFSVSHLTGFCNSIPLPIPQYPVQVSAPQEIGLTILR
jgi:hypothetical protein